MRRWFTWLVRLNDKIMWWNNPHDARLWRPEKNHPPTDQCTVPECMDCGYRDCPYAEPLHYHHDGCPACAPTAKELAGKR